MDVDEVLASLPEAGDDSSSEELTLISYTGTKKWKASLPQPSHPALLQTHINFPRFLPIFPDFLERLSHLAPIY
jgi:hypothetical protein